jgi:hypothetical protein
MYSICPVYAIMDFFSYVDLTSPAINSLELIILKKDGLY